ncbi:MAG: hypothetical protein SFZ03_04700 [Candidatus Melainabacteria bacterium]|nr:hypothetical protein [Candidatus Melainabacteria bacterium]
MVLSLTTDGSVRAQALTASGDVMAKREALYRLGWQVHPDMTPEEQWHVHEQGQTLQVGIAKDEVMEEALNTWDDAIRKRQKKQQQRAQQNLSNGVIFGY